MTTCLLHRNAMESTMNALKGLTFVNGHRSFRKSGRSTIRRWRRLKWGLLISLDVFAHGLGIAPGPPRDGGDGQSLSMQFQNHHEFSKSDHLPRLLAKASIGREVGRSHSAAAGRATVRAKGPPNREFSEPTLRENCTTYDNVCGCAA